MMHLLDLYVDLHLQAYLMPKPKWLSELLCQKHQTANASQTQDNLFCGRYLVKPSCSIWLKGRWLHLLKKKTT